MLNSLRHRPKGDGGCPRSRYMADGETIVKRRSLLMWSAPWRDVDSGKSTTTGESPQHPLTHSSLIPTWFTSAEDSSSVPSSWALHFLDIPWHWALGLSANSGCRILRHSDRICASLVALSQFLHTMATMEGIEKQQTPQNARTRSLTQVPLVRALVAHYRVQRLLPQHHSSTSRAAWCKDWGMLLSTSLQR